MRSSNIIRIVFAGFILFFSMILMESVLLAQNGANTANGQPTGQGQPTRSKPQLKPMFKVPDFSGIFRLKTPALQLKKKQESPKTAPAQNHYVQNPQGTPASGNTGTASFPRSGVVPQKNPGNSTAKTLYGLKKGNYTPQDANRTLQNPSS
ncbi:MAG: hypothetical protein Q4G69_12270, partial [Planctomycetia bacterium]|nr:hypothetical protein [Planctomycetia bacterium]